MCGWTYPANRLFRQPTLKRLAVEMEIPASPYLAEVLPNKASKCLTAASPDHMHAHLQRRLGRLTASGRVDGDLAQCITTHKRSGCNLKCKACSPHRRDFCRVTRVNRGKCLRRLTAQAADTTGVRLLTMFAFASHR